MVVNIDRVFAREEYATLSYNTRCWVRIRTELIGCMMLLLGVLIGDILL